MKIAFVLWVGFSALTLVNSRAASAHSLQEAPAHNDQDLSHEKNRSVAYESNPASQQPATSKIERLSPDPDLPAGLRCLWIAYPDQICQVRDNSIVWCDGTEMPYDDGRSRQSHEELLNSADLEDMMSMAYPVGEKYPIPVPVNFEPGRVRNETFFRKIYGETRKAVKKNTALISWTPSTTGKKLRVTTINQVHKKLEAVAAELTRLPPRLRKYVEETAGTFNWRKIKGTTRMSMHSFAVAIDVGVPYSDYWRWVRPSKKGGVLPYRNRFPIDIVEIFEKYGFIWGGKWYHFDTMHFEYRPELLVPLCRAKN